MSFDVDRFPVVSEPTSPDNAGGTDPIEEGQDSPTTRNSMSGSASSVFQAGYISGNVTQNYHIGDKRGKWARWGWTATAAVLLATGVPLLVRTLGDEQLGQPPSDGDVMPVVAAVEPLVNACGADWFTPKPPDQIRGVLNGKPNSWSDLDHLADGGFADNGKLLVTLQGTHADRSVTVTGIEVEVVSRNPPPAGTVLHARCGDAPSYRYVDVNLDDSQPRVTGRPVDLNAVQEAQRNGWRTDPIAFPYEVTSTDAETFLLDASTTSCDCSWIVHFAWSSGGRTGKLTVPDGGGSFRVVSGASAARCDILIGLECR
ncbi:hypothetical protein [Lentzea sp. CC55]|uniref:hypothetical protein n=1 Tax=Lentzea sp. CC55 TaxID=2884909 RepID=UPI001F415073|nr:hypothetical protein [Lentzea sp. CC55]MCG8927438.1 hypothetical protein [Lentzea sp. CC55]